MDDYCYECTGYGDNYYYDEELDDYVCCVNGTSENFGEYTGVCCEDECEDGEQE